MQLLILSDGVYNDEHNRARARKAGELHTALPDYGQSLIASGLAMTLTKKNTATEAEAQPAPPPAEPVTLDLNDGVSDQEARAAGQALKQRRKRK
jgi:hypothetical protein